MRRDVFQAIADPTRREIINMLVHKKLNLNSVAENFRMSRPAISKHIKILTECGLIVIEQQGRERHCEVKLQKLSEVAVWVEQYRQFWNKRLDALENYLTQIQSKIKKENQIKKEMKAEPEIFEGKKMLVERLVNAPCALVWDAWTKPEHIKHWWGPEGFTNTIQTMDVKPGGIWEFTMHGPDGVDYKNKIVYVEIVRHKKLVLNHVSGPKFEMTVNFEARGNQTFVSVQGNFESAEQLRQLIQEVKADVGLVQTVSRMKMHSEKLLNQL
ncbi:MAG: metalloregulator ArsR/SmtB family transcription factor [Cyclobacteriaceae bacterium]